MATNKRNLQTLKRKKSTQIIADIFKDSGITLTAPTLDTVLT